MRDIKFRGKHVTEANALYPAENTWIYGFLLIKDGEYWINDIDNPLKTYRVEKESVGQYTGIKDKNGKEIYEGDVVKLSSPRMQVQIIELIGEVAFSDFGGYRVENIKAIKWDGFSVGAEPPEYLWFLNLVNGNKGYEIIGNIYENPELLEANSD